MKFDSARTVAELTGSFFGRRTCQDLFQDIAFTRRQHIEEPTRACGNSLRCARGDRLRHTARNCIRIERLFDKVERAALDGFDSSRDIALAGDDNDWNSVTPGSELLEAVEPRSSRQTDVQQNASGSSSQCGRKERISIRERTDSVPFVQQYDCERITHCRIVIDD